MSLYFSKHSLNGYRDQTGTVDPAIRDRLVSAINELTLLGPGLAKHKELSTRMQSQSSRPRSTRTANRANNDRIVPPQAESAVQVKIDTSLQSLGQSTTEPSVACTYGALKGKIKHITSTAYSNPEKGNVVVFARVLHQETEYKKIEVTSLTTSGELVNTVLRDYDADTKDPNLFYLAMETGIKSKDSGLPISQMIVLEDNARPLELQACQPQGETKFHLKMKSGGLIRVRTTILNTGSTFKTVFIARCTTAQELIKLIINGCKINEAPEHFVLREGSTDFQVDRILTPDEYPLEVQTNWKPDGERSFFLSRINNTHDTIPAQATEIPTSDELKNEIEKQNQTINTLNETINKLQQDEEKYGLRSSRNDFSMRTSSSVDSGYLKDDYDQIDDIDIKPFEAQEGYYCNDLNEGDRPSEQMRQQKPSIDALDLNQGTIVQPISAAVQTQSTCSQINKLSRSFYQFQKQNIDALDACNDKKGMGKRTVDSRSSQIERFRLKFLEYYNVKSDGSHRRMSSVLTPPRPRPRKVSQESDLGRSYSVSDAEPTRIDPQFHCELQTFFSRKSFLDITCDKEIEDVFESSPKTQEFLGEDSANLSFLSIFDILEEMRLVKVTLERDPGKELGLEIAHVTQTGSSVDEEKDADNVVYVFHKGDGQTAVVESPIEHTDTQNDPRGFTTITEPSRPKYSEHMDDRNDLFPPVNVESQLNNTNFSVHTVEDSTHVTSKDEKTSSNVESCCAFSQWRESLGHKPRHGVRIVRITKGSVAEATRGLKRGDVIVEVNGRNVLNSSLDAVIATLKQLDSVQLVVAREKRPSAFKGNTVAEPLPVQSSLPSHHDDTKALTDQVQQLVTKVTQLQDSLSKKDLTISSLKKSLIKKKMRISSKEKIVEGEQVMV